MDLRVLFGLVVCLTSVFAKPNGGCQGTVLKVNSVNYVRELIKDNIEVPRYLGYDRSTNSLFFRRFGTGDDLENVGAKLNLDTNELTGIDNVKVVGSVAVDVKTNDVYLNIEREIFEYNKDNNKAEFVDFFEPKQATFAKIVFAKDNTVYVSALPSSKVYKVVDFEISKFKDLKSTRATNLAIDDSNNIFFSNNTGLYRKKEGSQETVYYKNTNNLTFDGITLNKAGDIYAFGETGIYSVNKDTNEIIKVFDVNARGLTFDGDDNIIYADSEEIYRLKRYNDPICV